jgi:hypothetical protein
VSTADIVTSVLAHVATPRVSSTGSGTPTPTR